MKIWQAGADMIHFTVSKHIHELRNHLDWDFLFLFYQTTLVVSDSALESIQLLV